MIVTYYRGEELPPYLEGILDWANEKFFRFIPTGADCWIAGGACVDYFQQREPKDLDIWFNNEESFNILCRNLNGIPHCWKMACETPSSVSYIGQNPFLDLDLVRSSWFDSMEQTLEAFDISVAQFAVGRDQVAYNEKFFEYVFTGTMAFENMRVPTNTLRRLPKYVQKGFTPPDSELEKLATRLSELDMDDPKQNYFEHMRRAKAEGKKPDAYSTMPNAPQSVSQTQTAQSNPFAILKPVSIPMQKLSSSPPVKLTKSKKILKKFKMPDPYI